MSRWQGCWLVCVWLLLPNSVRAWEPLLIPRTAAADSIADHDAPLRLMRQTGSPSDRSAGKDDQSRAKSGSWTTTTASLLFVLTLIAGGAYLLKRQGRRFAGMLPDEVVQVLGRRFLDQRHSLQFVRCGSKILILGNSTQHGLSTLSEITDPHEVELITAQCLGGATSSSSILGRHSRTDSSQPLAASASHIQTRPGPQLRSANDPATRGSHG